MKFVYDRKPEVLSKLSYNPEEVISKISEVSEYLSDRLNVELEVSRKYEMSEDIKPSNIYCTLDLKFTSDITRLSGTMQIMIPDIRGYTVIKGIKRFVQNQIRDLLYISKPKSCRVISEYPALTMYQTKQGPVLSIEGNPAYALPLHFVLASSDEQGIDLQRLEKFENLEEQIKRLTLVTKEDEYFKMMSQARNTSINRSKYVYELVLALHKTSPMLRKFFARPCDIVIDMIERLEDEETVSDSELGLDLKTRRLRTVQEIVTYNLCWEIITKLLYNRFIISKQRRDLNCIIDPFRGIYDFVLTETMFHSPLATLSNKFRVILTGQGGFTKDNVPLRLKDLHPSQFRNICPVVTPDREKAGIVLYLAYSSNIDETGCFEIHELKETESLKEI